MKTLVVVFLLIGGLMAGCSGVGIGRTATSVITSQAPGAAVGAGAAIIGPNNSAAPTTQVAERRTAYYAPQADLAGIAAYIHAQTLANQQPPVVAPSTPSQPVAISPYTPPQFPAWTYEKVSTTIGQHQDAAGLVKVAQTASGWPWCRWLGIGLMIAGIGGWLYSYNNKETGYPLIWIKVFVIGAIVALVGSNPWLLLLLLIPLGFYVAQKAMAAGLIRLPTLP